MQKFVPAQMDVSYNAGSSSNIQNIENINKNLIIETKDIENCEKTIMKKSQETKNLEKKNIMENHPIKYKMSGYLKKKRNKVAGWRKIWCVLQDQLLLSFNSKEDCDKDLLSFKDILNIVPGTTVKPLDRLNFTIETTTNCCYTFRCLDRESCTNWITALVECLPVKFNGLIQQDILNSNGIIKYNASMDNIALAADLSKSRSFLDTSVKNSKTSIGKHGIRMSISCESIHNSNYNKYKMPKIPIAEATAKLLQRNGMDDIQPVNSKYKNLQSNMDQILENMNKIEGANIFRLHDKHVSSSGFVNQSNEVSRINRMFDDNTKKILFQNKIHDKLKDTQEDESVLNDSNLLNKQFIRESIKNKFDINDYLNNKGFKLNSLRNRKRIDDSEIQSNKPKNYSHDIYLNSVLKDCKNSQKLSVKNNNKFGSDINIKVNKIESYFYGMNQSGSSDIGSVTSSIEEHVKNLNLNDNLKSEGISIGESINVLPQTGTNNSWTTSQHDNRRDPMVVVNENEICLSDLQKYYPIKHVEESPESNGAEYSEIIFPTSTSSNSLITKKQQSLINDTSSNSIALENNEFIRNSKSLINDDNIKTENEPIYAVVNLKNKYEQRKHRKKNFDLDLRGQTHNAIDTVDGSHKDDAITGGKPRPKSAIFISSGDYEEVLNFSTESLRNDDDTPDASSESENIYEPINIPYDSHYSESPHRVHALWKYFSIDALIEMAKSRKSRHKSNKLEHSLSSPLSTSLTDTQQDHISNSPFSVLRRKLGNHRKSIKLRMKKFYKRNNNSFMHNNCANPVIVNERNAFSDDELDSQGASGSTGSGTSESLKSITGNSGDKQYAQIFENFPRLSKPRPSLCLDQHGSRNKILLLSSKLNGFHRETRKSSIKRSGRKNTGYTP